MYLITAINVIYFVKKNRKPGTLRYNVYEINDKA